MSERERIATFSHNRFYVKGHRGAVSRERLERLVRAGAISVIWMKEQNQYISARQFFELRLRNLYKDNQRIRVGTRMENFFSYLFHFTCEIDETYEWDGRIYYRGTIVEHYYYITSEEALTIEEAMAEAIAQHDDDFPHHRLITVRYIHTKVMSGVV